MALILLVPAPSIGVLAAMYILPGSIGQAIFSISKVWLLALPLLWLMLVDRQRPRLPRPRSAGLTMGLITGGIIFLGIWAIYLLVGSRWIDADFVRQQAMEVGLSTPTIYIAASLYFCIINSLLEEYVWRWFAFTRCERLLPSTTGGRAAAVLLAAAFFTLHHVLALLVYFDPFVAALASLGVFIGGATWSWLYLRYRNLYAAWISHILADAIIFAIGYRLIFM